MRNVWLVAIIAVVVLISGCTGQKTETQPVTSNAVDIKGFAFDPANVTITKGTTVTWTNRDTAPHTVTGMNNSFSSETLNEGQSYGRTFNEAGTFEYECHIHPRMRGKVIVT